NDTPDQEIERPHETTHLFHPHCARRPGTAPRLRRDRPCDVSHRLPGCGLPARSPGGKPRRPARGSPRRPLGAPARPLGLLSTPLLRKAMKISPPLERLAFLAVLLAFANHGLSKDFTPEELTQRSIERRAVEAVLWGMPAVNYDLMRQTMLNVTD